MEKSDARNYRVKLLYEMRYGQYANSDRLPRETELAEMLHISRTQLRDVLSELEREGYITRRHGVGTIINHHVLQVKNRMDIEVEFSDIIRNCGYTPEMVSEEVWESEADEHIAEKLQIPLGAPVWCKRSVCTADGNPAICWMDVVDKGLIKKECSVECFKTIIFQFLQEYCEVSSYMDLTELHAVAADEQLAEALRVPIGTPLLNMEEVDFDIEGKPIFYSDQYFTDGMISHTVLRKKL